MRLRLTVNYSRENSVGRGRPDTFTVSMPHPGAPFVGVYATFRQYGGPEEGGWWYDAGDLVASTRVNPKKKGAARKLRAFARKLDTRVPCISCESVLVLHRPTPLLPYYPERRPHYE